MSFQRGCQGTHRLALTARSKSGAFPPTALGGQPTSSLLQAEALSPLMTALGNYPPFEDNAALTGAELKKERDNGFFEWSTDRAAMEEKCGPLVLSRVGAIVKRKRDRVSVRLIHDLCRSLINVNAQVPERIALPLLRDAVDSLLEVVRAMVATDAVDITVLDVASAFKQLKVDPSERR